MIGGRGAAFARGALTHSLLLPLAHKVRFRVLQHIVRPIAQHRLGEVAQDGLELLRYSDVHRCPFSRPDPRRRGLTPERCGSTTTKAASDGLPPLLQEQALERFALASCIDP